MIELVVVGTPRPGGSKKPFRLKSGKLGVRDDNQHTAVWRSDVSAQASQQYKGPLLSGAITMRYEFRFQRPKSHYRNGRFADQLRADAPTWHTQKPDLTKIIRSTEDALTGIVWQDDALVCDRSEIKRYCNEGEHPGVSMVIGQL